MNWFKFQQKHKPQSNALSIGVMLMYSSGMHISFILNFTTLLQEWTRGLFILPILWVIASWYLAVIIGLIVGRTMIPMCGKKLIGFVAIGFYTVSGILFVAVPTHVSTILIGRCLAGIGHGLAYLTTIIHGSEILMKQFRGLVLSSLSYTTMISIVIFMSVTVNLYDPNINTFMDPNRILGIFQLVFVGLAALFGFFYTHESPIFLMQRNKESEAKIVMRKLRSDTVDTEEMLRDYEDLKAMVAEDSQLDTSIFKNGNTRPLLTIVALRVLSVLTFNYPLNLVRVSLAQSPLPMMAVYIWISAARLLTSTVSNLTMDLVRRRVYFLISSVGSVVTLAALAILVTINPIVNAWVYTGLVFLFDAMAGTAIVQLTDIYSAEAFPLPKKLDSLIVTNVVENLLQAGLVMSMVSAQSTRGTYLAILYAFTILIAGCTAYLALQLPETLKKSIRETRDLFRGYSSGAQIPYSNVQNMPKTSFS